MSNHNGTIDDPNIANMRMVGETLNGLLEEILGLYVAANQMQQSAFFGCPVANTLLREYQAMFDTNMEALKGLAEEAAVMHTGIKQHLLNLELTRLQETAACPLEDCQDRPVAQKMLDNLNNGTGYVN
jgi:hypothetical protein